MIARSNGDGMPTGVHGHRLYILMVFLAGLFHSILMEMAAYIAIFTAAQIAGIRLPE
jgi:hypothetical protein